MEGGKRYIVRPRYVGPAEGGGDAGAQRYQVVDGHTNIGSHRTTEAAATQVLQLNGRIACRWERTVIGGHATPKDFSAFWGDITVGRVQWSGGTAHSGGGWRWSEFAQIAGKGMGGARGQEDERLEAAAALELAFTRHLAQTPYRSSSS